MATKEQVQEALNQFEYGGKFTTTTYGDKPIHCDLCENPVALVDGKTSQGSWAYMCAICFSEHGIGLGLGKGQVLRWKSDGL